MHQADFIFLSTSRVYPIKLINELEYVEKETRIDLAPDQKRIGVSSNGFNEHFPLEGTRSLYGTTKLCSEYVIQEYCEMYGIRAVINRCAVLTGPWQMGKVDQGVVSLWVARHIFKGELGYFGYGGHGRQVRDILHVDDLFRLLLIQLENLDQHNSVVYNVGGGLETSISLQELTSLCEQVTGNRIKISSVPENRVADIPYFITDNTKVTKATGWRPEKRPVAIVKEIAEWILDNKAFLNNLLT